MELVQTGDVLTAGLREFTLALTPALSLGVRTPKLLSHFPDWAQRFASRLIQRSYCLAFIADRSIRGGRNRT